MTYGSFHIGAAVAERRERSCREWNGIWMKRAGAKSDVEYWRPRAGGARGSHHRNLKVTYMDVKSRPGVRDWNGRDWMILMGRGGINGTEIHLGDRE